MTRVKGHSDKKKSRRDAASDARQEKIKKPKRSKHDKVTVVAAPIPPPPPAPAAAVAAKKPRKPHRFRKGTVALRNMRKYQTSAKFMLAGSPYRREMRAIGQDIKPDMRFTKDSMTSLQEIGESFLHSVFGDAAKMMLHRTAVTAQQPDFRLAVHMSDVHAPLGLAGRELLAALPPLQPSKRQLKALAKAEAEAEAKAAKAEAKRAARAAAQPNATETSE